MSALEAKLLRLSATQIHVYFALLYCITETMVMMKTSARLLCQANEPRSEELHDQK